MDSRIVFIFFAHLLYKGTSGDSLIHSLRGSSVLLPCKGKDFWKPDSDAGVSWHHCFQKKCEKLLVTITAMGEVVNPENQERIKTQPNMIQSADFSLTISDVQLSDEGSYQCTLYDSKSIKMIYTIKLKVHREKGGTPSTASTVSTASTASTEPPLSVQSAPLQSATPLWKCSVTGPPSLQLTVIVIGVCVTFLLLGPLLFLYCRYKLLLQRITSLSSNNDDVQDSNLRPRRNEEHIYTEIIERNNTNVVANSLSGTAADQHRSTKI
ncbi:hypothetical protein AOXY_G19954 [Acipenser oxyrinchus oxyrinchus]|uniref:Ig-like domain-containing protein n=1 Tax=Acipenser oxyrinchus oxyrinchus TaxID=40147 RepID=A0AAD8CZR7_ACIOX|nr:hypothetical protein AOXY_G19954 [Acipenser oxyrinchus oxyrinchus]